MTTQDHNRMLGIMHLIYGGFNGLVMLVFIPFLVAFIVAAAADPSAPGAIVGVFAVLGILMLLLAVMFGLVPLLAGYAMLTRKSRARTLGIVSAVLCALSFPFGTALCAYTFWFLFGPGEHFYRGEAGALGGQYWHAPLPDASTFGREAQGWSGRPREHEYVPPPEPPDWRGQ